MFKSCAVHFNFRWQTVGPTVAPALRCSHNAVSPCSEPTKERTHDPPHNSKRLPARPDLLYCCCYEISLVCGVITLPHYTADSVESPSLRRLVGVARVFGAGPDWKQSVQLAKGRPCE